MDKFKAIDLLIEEVLNEETPFLINKKDTGETQEFENFEDFTNAVQNLDNNQQYTIVSPQTGEDGASASGKTFKDYFEKPEVKDEDPTAPVETGYLADIPVKAYREDGVELPTLFVQAFENSGFTQGSYQQRLNSLNTFFAELATSDDEQVGIQPTQLSTQFSNIIVAESLEKIINYIYLGGVGRLEKGGFLFESFLALLFSGTQPVDRKSYADIIDNKANNISVKFIAKSSSNFQAWSTVSSYFENNSDPMIHIVAVKERVSQTKGSVITIYQSVFTADDFNEINTKVESNPETVQETDKAVYTPPGSKYGVKNDWENNTAKYGAGSWSPEKQPRITYLQYGTQIGKIMIPPPEKMRTGTKSMMSAYNDSIDLLFKELTNFRKLSINFFSAKEDKKDKADKVIESYGKLKTYVNEGFEHEGIDKIQENKMAELDLMVEETIRELLKGNLND